MADFSVYPLAIDGYSQLPLVVDQVTRVDAISVNRLRSAIINIEAELGIEPSGSYDTVRARLDALESLLSDENLGYKNPARVATTGNIPDLTGGAPNIVDGVSLQENDRVLVYQQTDLSQNGIYQVQTLGTGSNGIWLRTVDANTVFNLIPGTEIFVTEGLLNGLTKFWLITPGPLVIDTTPLEFADGVTIMRSDSSPTTILTSSAIGNGEANATSTSSIAVRNFKELDFSFSITNLASISDIRIRILYSLLSSPDDYDTNPEDWSFMLAEGIIEGIATNDAYTISLDVDEYPGFESLPASFAFRSPVAGLHMMLIIWSESGSPVGSAFQGIVLRRV